MVVGALLLHVAPPAWGAPGVSLSAFVIGAGLGTVLTPMLIMVQSSVEWGRRGAATALNQFARTIGGAVGVSLMGVLLQSRIRSGAVAHGLDPSRLGNPLDPSVSRVRGGVTVLLMSSGLEAVFWVFVGLAATALVASIAITLRASSSAGSSAPAAAAQASARQS